MHLLTAFSLKNRALIALVTIVAAVFGVIGAGSLKQELMPSVQFPAIAVVTSYPGASPEVVNADVSGPIETAMRGVPQLESTTSTSSTGASMIVAQFTYGVDLAVTEQKVERAISRISAVLPAAADSQVVSGSIDDFPVIQVAVTPAEGQTAEEAAALVSRLVTPKLSDLDGVRDAQLSGDRTERVMIKPNLEALAHDGLSTQTLTDTLQQSGVLIAAGTVADGDQTLAVQAGSTVDSAEAIAALPIPGTPAPVNPEAFPQELPGVDPFAPVAPAPPLTIGAYAEVVVEGAPETSISRVDGKPALTIAVTKMSAANTVEVSHAVQAELDRLSSQLDGAKLTVIFDQAPYIEQSVETLTTEGLLGLLFAVLVILVFLLSVRATLVTAISIPVSVLFTFIGLNFADYTLNMLTLGALTISIGRVVDDSIVVIENIKRHFGEAGAEVGAHRAEIIVRAVREVGGAITASTVTTVAVFLPMAFVSGMVGELFSPFAFTVTIALAASLFVSLTIVPVLAYWFLPAEQRGEDDSALPPAKRRGRLAAWLHQAKTSEGPTALQRWYRPVIEWTLARPAITLIVAVAIFGGTIAATPLMKTNFMGADEQNSVGLVQTLEPGTSLEAQLAQAERVEEVLDTVAAVETVQLTIGSGGGGMSAMFGGGGDGAINYSITTDPDADQPKMQDEIRAAVATLDEAGEFSISQSGGSPGMSSSIEINVAAPDQATLAEASEVVLQALQNEEGLKQVESDLGRSRPYLSVTVNRDAAAQAGLTEAAVAGQVAQQMQPQQIGQITRDAHVTSVYLAAGNVPTDIAGVSALAIQTATGPQRLDALAAVEVADGPVSIHTADGARTVTVSALPAGDDLSAASVSVNNALDAAELPAGATASIGGVMSQQAEAFEQLGIALLAAILIVYVVMVATFRSLLQPLLLLASVPFAATGALLLLIITGIPLGVASLIGVLMLIGIVVTNAIVLVDLVNQYRERGDALRDAVLHGTLQRLRPIVMTALATILALTPMGLGVTGQGGFISQPLAVVVIGGLLSSTVLTLVVLPTLYYIVERRREGDSRPRRQGSPQPPREPRGPRRSRANRASAETGGATGLSWLASLTGAGSTEGGPRRTGSMPVAGVPLIADPAVGAVGASADATFTEPAPLPRRRRGGAQIEGAPSEATSQTGAPESSEASDMPDAPDALDASDASDAPSPAVPATRAQDFVRAQSADEVSTPTAEMSLALEDLGFVADEVLEPGAEPEAATQREPLVEDLASDTWNATDEIAPLVLPGPLGADPARDETVAVPEVVPAPEPEVAPVSASLLSTPIVAAPPVTGELNWEQLMWEATQEVAQEADEEMSSDSPAVSAGEQSSEDASKIHQADAPDQRDHTGPVPSEEQ